MDAYADDVRVELVEYAFPYNQPTAIFRLVNDSPHLVRYEGYSSGNIVYESESLAGSGWEEDWHGWCGVGLGRQVLAARSAVRFTVDLDDPSRTSRVTVVLRTEDGEPSRRVTSLPFQIPDLSPWVSVDLDLRPVAGTEHVYEVEASVTNRSGQPLLLADYDPLPRTIHELEYSDPNAPASLDRIAAPKDTVPAKARRIAPGASVHWRALYDLDPYDEDEPFPGAVARLALDYCSILAVESGGIPAPLGCTRSRALEAPVAAKAARPRD